MAALPLRPLRFYEIWMLKFLSRSPRIHQIIVVQDAIPPQPPPAPRSSTTWTPATRRSSKHPRYRLNQIACQVPTNKSAPTTPLIAATRISWSRIAPSISSRTWSSSMGGE